MRVYVHMYVYYDYAHYHESDADAVADGDGNAGSLSAPVELGYDSKLKLPQRGCILVYTIAAG